MSVRLLHGDCLELLRDIPNGSVDCIIADLPYGTTECKWDSVIPIAPLWEQYRRVVKPNGVICLFGSEPFPTKLRVAALDLYKYDWVWKKTTPTGFVHAKNMPLKDYELISVFSGGSINHKSLVSPEKRMPYNPQGVKLVNRIAKARRNKHGNISGIRPSHKERYVQEYENFPRMVIEFPKERGFHPVQKPVALLEYLVRTYTSEGEVVLDNVMGSGSTGVACVNAGRGFIGIELDPGYFEIAQRRIQAAQDAVSRAGAQGSADAQNAATGG